MNGYRFFITFGMILLLFCYHATQAEMVYIGDTIQGEITAEKPFLSYEFIPHLNCTLRIHLERTSSKIPIHLVIFRIPPTRPAFPLGSHRLEPELAEVTLSVPATVEVLHRIVVYSQAPAESGGFLLRIQGMDTYGSLVLLKGENQTEILSAATGKILARLPVAGTAEFYFSPNGEQILTRQETDWRLFDAYSGHQIGERFFNGTFRFLPDKDRLLLQDQQAGSVLLMSSTDFQILGEYPGTSFQASANAGRLAIAGATTAFVIDPDNGAIVSQWEGGDMVSTTLSPDGKTAAVWQAGNSFPIHANLLNTEAGLISGAPLLFSSTPTATFSPDGSRVLWCGVTPENAHHKAILQSTTNGSILAQVSHPRPGKALSGSFGSLSRTVVITPAEPTDFGRVFVLDNQTGTEIHTILPVRESQFVVMHPSEKTLIWAGKVYRDFEEQLEVKVIDLDSGRQVRQFSLLEVYSATYNSTGNRIALLGLSATTPIRREEIFLLDGQTGNLIRDALNSSRWLANSWADPLFSPDGRRLITQSQGIIPSGVLTNYTIWNTQNGSALTGYGFGEIQAQGFSPDSSRFYILARFGLSPRVLRVINLETGLPVGFDIGYASAYRPRFCPDGKCLLIAAQRENEGFRRVDVIQLEDASVRRAAGIQFSEGSRPQWSGDGKRILVNYADSNGDGVCALIESNTLQKSQIYPAFSGGEFDSTVKPRFADYDFNRDGKVNSLDLFELQGLLDPDYRDILYPFQNQSKWRNSQ